MFYDASTLIAKLAAEVHPSIGCFLNCLTLYTAVKGLVAEWLRRGLQILAPQFDSGRGLQISYTFSVRGCPYPNFLASDGQRRLSQCPSLTVILRLNRRTMGISTESTNNPNGTIQKPNIGKNPNTPPTHNTTPSAMRRTGWLGTCILCPAKVIFVTVFLFSKRYIWASTNKQQKTFRIRKPLL
jgi:hypothetical protein